MRAIGWLESPHSFDQGRPPQAFVDKFATLVDQTKSCFAQHTFRGLHGCDQCAAAGLAGRHFIDTSAVNVLVPGRGEVFAATGGLLHYVAEHAYLPPRCFIDAVMSCPPCDSAAYLDALRVANGNVAPPMETFEFQLRRDCLERAARQRFRDELGRPIKDATREQVVRAAAKAWPDAPPAGGQGDVRLGTCVAVFDDAGRFLRFADD
ncbi:MAG: hypothetical protein M3N82_16980 [Pseudomonadota bacterium]|nr:hypothetical protein [Pseudomonadota bacterium]